MKDYNAIEMEIKYNVLKAQELVKGILDDARDELAQAETKEQELEAIVMELERAWELTESPITGESLDRAEKELYEAWNNRMCCDGRKTRLNRGQLF